MNLNSATAASLLAVALAFALTTAQAAPVAATLTAPEPIAYLAQRHFALGTLAPALAAASGLTATLESGPAFDFVLSPTGVLHLLAPAEQLAGSHSVLRIQNANHTKRWRLRLNWVSPCNSPLQRIQEHRPDKVGVVAEGAGACGLLSAGTPSLAYRVVNGPRLRRDSMFVNLSSTAGQQDVTAWFDLAPDGKRLSLQPARMAELRKVVGAAGGAQLSFSLSSANYAKTVGFAHNLLPADGALNLALVNADASPARQAAGMRFVARQAALGYAVVGTLDASGHAQFSGLPAGGYVVEEVALHDRPALAGQVDVPGGDVQEALTLRLPAEGAGPAAALSR